MTILLRNDFAAKCWTAIFRGVPGMPEGQALPLPYTNSAGIFIVATDLQARYPQAAIYQR